jgi:hypothetical protein
MTFMTTTKEDATHDVIKTDVLGRVRVKPKTCEQILDEFERSGMSGRSFAKHHGIKEQTFASWIQKRRRARGDYQNEEILRKLRMPKEAASLNGPARATPSPKSTALSLIEVALPSADNSVQTEPCAKALEVVLPCGAVVRINNRSQLGLLKALLEEVGSC